MKFLDGYREQAYALLRMVAGLLFLAHGVQKFFNFPTDFPMPLNPMLYAAGTIELVADKIVDGRVTTVGLDLAEHGRAEGASDTLLERLRALTSRWRGASAAQP